MTYYIEFWHALCTFFIVPGEPLNFAVIDLALLDSSFVWSPPNKTNGIITNYTLWCTPEKPYLPNCTETIKSYLYIQGQNFTEISSCLERGLNYVCYLNASNDAGSGPSTSTKLREGVLQSEYIFVWWLSIVCWLVQHFSSQLLKNRYLFTYNFLCRKVVIITYTILQSHPWILSAQKLSKEKQLNVTGNRFGLTVLTCT